MAMFAGDIANLGHAPLRYRRQRAPEVTRATSTRTIPWRGRTPGDVTDLRGARESTASLSDPVAVIHKRGLQDPSSEMHLPDFDAASKLRTSG